MAKKESKIQNIYDLSPMQEGMLFHALFNADDVSYFEQSEYTLEGTLNLTAFENSFNELIKRHDVLRSIFIHEKVLNPKQVVLKERASKIHFENLSDLTPQQLADRIEQFKIEDRQKGFLLSKDLLIRAAILKTGPTSCIAIWSFHHILMDGWCLSILLKDFFALYESQLQGNPAQLGQIHSYGNYIKWLQSKDRTVSTHYWKTYLDNYEAAVDFPGAIKHKQRVTYHVQHERHQFNKDETVQLTKAAAGIGVSLSAFLHTCWGILLQKYNNSGDIIFGSVVSGRPSEVAGIETMIGLFINTIPVRVKSNPDDAFWDIVTKFNLGTAESKEHEYFPLAEIQNLSNQKSGLINHIFVVENFMTASPDNNPGMTESSLKVKDIKVFEQTSYDLNVMVLPSDELTIEWAYNAAVFTPEVIQQYRNHLIQIIRQVVSNPKISVRAIQFLSEQEKERVLHTFNDHPISSPIVPVLDLIRSNTQNHPDKIAFTDSKQSVSYQDLWNKSDNLAQLLLSKGIGQGKIVPVKLGRSVHTIIAILGIIKTGAAYVFVDPNYPEDRIAFMLEDCASEIIATDTIHVGSVPSNVEALILDQIELSSGLPVSEIPAPEFSVDQLAYLIYTSGSTGRPKGVKISHGNLNSFVHWCLTEFADTPFEILYNATSYSFDLSIYEIFFGLCRGTHIRILQDGLDIANHLGQDNNVLLNTVPVVIKELLFNKTDLSPVIAINMAGEPIPQVVKDELDYSKTEVRNLYGPSEDTTYSTIYRLRKPDYIQNIGRPIAGTQAYILDNENRPLPVGVAGELCLAGDGVSLGYLHREDLTLEKFVPNPFEEGKKMYRTGDLTRWLPQGEIEYLGRIDNQVKIRGFRIELGEIEQKLFEFPAIQDCVVADVLHPESGEKALCAYYIGEQELNTKDAKAFLAEFLPVHMIPSIFTRIEEIPTTPNGKVDKKALPAPSKMEVNHDFVAPQTENEKRLAAIWSEILKVEKIGLNDNFFDLGGHSLKTTILSSRILKEFEVQFPLREVFNRPVLSSQIQWIEGKDSEEFSGITKAETKEFYALSSAQKRLFLIDRIEGQSTQYNIPAVLDITGKLNPEKFEKAINLLLERHEVLRTSFHLNDQGPVQKINPFTPFKITVKQVAETDIERYTKTFIQPFDLAVAPLLRIEMLRINEEKHVLLFDMHHIISDGVSQQIFVAELSSFYNDRSLPQLRIQYKDYSEWQKEYFISETFQQQKSYWVDRFKETTEPLNLPLDFNRPNVQQFDGKLSIYTIDKQRANKLRQLSKKYDATLYMTLMAVYNILLHKYSGNTTINVGTAIAGRGHADVQNLLGMFINTLVIKTEINPDQSFEHFIRSVKQHTLDAFSNQDFPFEELVEEVAPDRDLARNPLFDTMFILQNTGDSDSNKSLSDISIKPRNFEVNTAIFDLSIEAGEIGEEIQLNVRYCTRLFAQHTIDKLIAGLSLITDAVFANEQDPIRSIDIVSDLDRFRQLEEFGKGEEIQIPDTTLNELFENQVAKTPHATAVSFEGNTLTYLELNKKVNQVAFYLTENGLKVEEIVGVLMERSMEMVIALLAIQKAGGAYLPIDPDYPSDRIIYMLSDSKVGSVLTVTHLSELLPESVNKIELDRPSVYLGNGVNLPCRHHSDHLAYIIYTSGSTGLPKGTMLQHKGVVNRILWMKEQYGINESDVILQKTTYVFDVSVWEFFMTLCYGAKLVLCTKETTYDPDLLIATIQKNSITTLHFVPSMFNVFLNALNTNKSQQVASVKRIFTSGEALQLESVKKHHKYLRADLHNLYGPTEASVDVTYFETGKNDGLVPIGKPVWNTKLYILDPDLNLLPTGVIGELHIAGVQLARGYANRAELTAEKFINNPYGTGKMYKTGDLVRWLPDGNIAYEGRIDHQVKIRGYRIELGEIENALLQHEGVKEVAVINKKDAGGDDFLCAYFVSQNGPSVASELHDFLSSYLPEYMVPSFFVRLEEIPLSSNGKLDRKSLPEPTGSASSEVQMVDGRNATEKQLLALWRNVLGTDQVGIKHDFFKSGGHSLKATQLVMLIFKEFNIEIPLKEIFANPTVEKLSAKWKSFTEGSYASIEAIETRPYYPLSSAQKRLFILNEIEGSSTTYNMPGAVLISGKLDHDQLQNTLNTLLLRHESLRTSFHTIHDQPVQTVHDPVGLFWNLEVVKRTENSTTPEELLKVFLRPFDLSRAPLVRALLIEQEDEKHILAFDMHHIISDGQSMKNLITEFGTIYNHLEPAPLRIQYKDFAAWQNELFDSGKIEEQKNFWLGQFEGNLPALTLPYDHSRPATQNFEGETLRFDLDQATLARLTVLAEQEGTTLFMLLMALYQVLLSKYSGQTDIVVGSPIAGRPHADLESIIGMFVNTMAIRSYPESDKSFTQYLSEIRSTMLSAYQNQDFPFDELVESLHLERNMSRNPLFDTMLVFQNFGSAGNSGSGLKFEDFPFENRISKFDLTLTLAENKNGLRCNIEYATKLFEAQTIRNLFNHFTAIIEQVCDNPSRSLGEISLLNTKDRHRLIHDFNQTHEVFPSDTTIIDLFEQIVSTHPDQIALEYNGRTLSYHQLNNEVNQLARYISSQVNDTSNGLVGIMLDRSEWMVKAVLAILKAGFAYVPIDSNYPASRIEYILDDARIELLVSQSNLIGSDLKTNCPVIDLYSEASQILSESTENPSIPISDSDLAYVIYTSGSTGNPKGCELQHGNFFNYIYWATNHYYKGTDAGNFGLYTSLSFDLTVTSIFSALLRGKKLYIYPQQEEVDAILTHTFSPGSEIDAVKITPAHIALLAHLELPGTNVEIAIVGGDQLTNLHVEILRRLNPKMKIFNEYGPTEATVGCIVKEIENTSDQILIGKPIANTQIYIVDDLQQPVPVGFPGEICISGTQVARGYLNRPELTREKFVSNPFMEGKSMYKTGDLARWKANGEIEYMGRIDQQVKIKGHRIETGEIEHQIGTFKGIKENVVVDRTDSDGNKYLCAYFIASGKVNLSELRQYLENQIPEFMIPAFLIQIESIPLTINGKVDKKALPVPHDLEKTASETYAPPRTPAERQLVNVWEDVLNIDKIGIHDSFFELGGDSIKAIQVSSRLKHYQLKLDLKDLFQSKTIAKCALKVKPLLQIASQDAVLGDIQLTPIQHKFFSHHMPEEHHYNQSVMLHHKVGFEIDVLEKALNALIKHHDALRIRFTRNGNEVIQHSPEQEKNSTHQIICVDLRHETDPAQQIGQITEEIQSSLSLEDGHLLKTALFKTGSGDHLLIVIHHLVIDGVSWRILLEDLKTAYHSAQSGLKIELPLKSHSFQTWSERLNSDAFRSEIEAQMNYWEKVTGSAPNQISKITGTDPNTYASRTGHHVEFSKEETENLLKNAPKAYHTEVNDLLLSALGLTISTWKNPDQILIDLEGHGREKLFSDIDVDRTVGWFTSLFPVSIDTRSTENLPEYILEVKENLRRIPMKGVGYGALKYLFRKNLNSNAEILFNYLGQIDASTDDQEIGFSSYSTGTDIGKGNPMEYALEVNGIVTNGKLSVNFIFPETAFESSEIIALAEKFKRNLLNVVAHCIAQSKTTFSASDFGDLSLSTTDFRYIKETIDQHDLEIDQIYRLSPMQQGMLFYALMDDRSSAYYEQTSFGIKGNINSELFGQAYQLLIDRFDILRTSFISDYIDHPRQVVLSHKISGIHIEDIRHLNSDKQADFIRNFAEQDRQKGFDLVGDVLMRVSLIRKSEDTYTVVWGFHHILMDGWCLSIIMKDFFRIYYALLHGTTPALENPTPYSGYIKWLQNQNYDQAKTYWSAFVQGYESSVSLPGRINLSGSEKGKVQMQHASLDLSPESNKALIRFASTHGVTINTVFQTLWGILLQKYNNTRDIMVGAVVSGRPAEIEHVEEIVGLFINTIPVRIHNSSDLTFEALVEQVQNQSLESGPFDFYPLAEIQALSVLKQNLIDHIIIFENYPVGEEIKKSTNDGIGFSIENTEVYEQTNYDFSINILPGETHRVQLEFNALAFHGAVLEKLLEHFNNLIVSALANPAEKVSSLQLLSEKERNLVTVGFNNTSRNIGSIPTVLELFEQQVTALPEQRAVVYNADSITYAQLDQESNKLANYLIGKGIGKEDLVSIMLNRSVEMIIAVLGVLKSGAAYVPVDPDYPQQRIDFLLEDSKSKLLITQEEISDKSGDTIEKVHLNASEIKHQPIERPRVVIAKNQLAYVIYTSGSTGKPKGVMVEHGSMVNVALAWREAYQLNSFEVKLLQMASFSFDVFVGDLLRTLINGGEMIICPSDVRLDPESLYGLIHAHQINIFESTPALMIPLMDYIHTENKPIDEMRLLIMGSDSCSTGNFHTLMERFGDQMRVINSYGVTEATIDSCFYETTLDHLPDTGIVPIGKPLNNTQLYILDEALHPTPIGVEGELCIGGNGLARGYFERPELTQEKFITNPFNQQERLYRTGDLAKWLEDGNIEFKGRIDYQVKIRGYRIELGEIESALLAHPQLHGVSVIDQEDPYGTKYLCAYYTSGQEQDKSMLQAHLLRDLPEYMVPEFFVKMEEIPLTPNGKVDRKALPNPIEVNLEKSNYKAPINPTETQLQQIWQDVLHLDRIGTEDNFFELGGHSIIATSLLARIHKVMGVKIGMKDLFEFPTIKGIDQVLNGMEVTGYSEIHPLPQQDYYALSPAQNRLWLLDQIQEGTSDYNIPGSAAFHEPVDDLALQQAFSMLIDRHESLRTNFISVDEKPVQVIQDKVSFDLEILDYSHKTITEDGVQLIYIEKASRAFDLGKDVLLRATLIKETPQKATLILVIHHIISDGWSMEILTKELSALYQSFKNGEDPVLEPLPVQYKDYAAWQNEQLTGEKLAAHQKYWHSTLAGELPVLQIPADFSTDRNLKNTGSIITTYINADITHKISELANKSGSSMFMVLLTAFNVVLSRLTGSSDIIIGTPIAGRDHENLQNLIGFFLNTVILRNQVDSGLPFDAVLSQVKHNTLEAMEHQAYPFEQLVDDLNIPRDINAFPITSIFFNMVNLGNEAHTEIQLQETKYSPHNRRVKFDVNLYATQYKNCVELTCDYKNELYSKRSIEIILNKLIQVLGLVADHPSAILSEISTQNEVVVPTVQVRYPEWYNTRLTILDRWNEIAQKYPENMAVHTSHARQSYATVDQVTNGIAHELIRKIGSGKNIAVCVDHNHLMLHGLLGTLKSANVYVPLDPNYPVERLQYILEDSSPSAIITDSHNLELIGKLNVQHSVVFNLDEPNLQNGSEHAPKVNLSADDLAYILFTSGSTGKPKGTIQTHGAVVHFIANYSQAMKFDPADRLTGFSSICFDSFVNDLYGAIFNGSTYYPLALKSGVMLSEVADWIDKHEITVWHSVPSVFRPFADELIRQGKRLNSLRLVKMTGEPSTREDFERFKQITSSECRFVVSYGATETTLSTINTFTHDQKINKRIVSAGWPVDQTKIQIVNEDQTPVDLLENGEIWVSSPFITKGYLQSEELNNLAFVQRDGKRFYKTGDLGRINSDGALEIIGRKDNQVKIRGIRIEIGEIENALGRHPEIQSVAVAVEYDSNQYTELVAYIVGTDTVTGSDLRHHLKKRVPDYMIPATFIRLDEIPLTPNGKTDRKALKRSNGMELAISTEYVAASGQIESVIEKIWKQVLNKDQIGIHDNFFELGGHSLKATQAVSRIKSELHKTVRLKDLFTYPTIAGLAQAIKSNSERTDQRIQTIEESEYYEVSSNQRRLWMMDKIEGASATYNMPKSVNVEGILDMKALRKAFDFVIDRHENLRTVFIEQDGIPKQKIIANPAFSVGYEDLSGSSYRALEELSENVAQQIFHLDQFPLLALNVVKTAENRYTFLFNMHHIISDGWSMRILIREVFQSYNAYLKNERPDFEPLQIQYKDFAHWQNVQLSGENKSNNETFWKEYLRNYPVVNIPTDYKRPEFQSFEGDEYIYQLPEELTSKFQELNHTLGMTLFSSLVSTVSILLSKYANQNDIIIGCPIAGRNEAEVESLIGFFVNTLVLRNQLDPDKSIEDNFNAIKNRTIEVFEHQEYPFDELVNLMVTKRALDRGPLFDIAVVLQNQNDLNEDSPIQGLEGLSISGFNDQLKISKFDLTFAFGMVENRLSLNVEYNTSLFQEATIQLMVERLEALMESVCDNTKQTLRALKLTSKSEASMESGFEDLEDGFNF